MLAVPPTAILVISLAMLWAGGAPAGFGAWLLAAGFPIALGAVTRDKRFAAVPALVWICWWFAGHVAPESAELTRTPWPLALTLAAVGVGGTLLAQRAVAPALERTAWLPPQHRLAPSIDGALDPSADPIFDDDDADVSDLVAEPLDDADAGSGELDGDAGTSAAEQSDEDAGQGAATPDAPSASDESDDGEFGDIVTTEDLKGAAEAE